MIFQKPEIFFWHSNNIPVDAKFSILIPSWNNLELLKLCVDSVVKNSTYRHQIIIHINEGIDGTQDWVKSKGFDYSYSVKNAGVCYSVNAMATLAKTNYIVYLNDDMYVCPKWDEIFLNEIQKQDGDLWYFSGTMIEPNWSRNKCAIAPFDFGKTANDFNEVSLLKFSEKLDRDNWFGASWPPTIVSKNMFEKVGGYSEEFSPGMYSDPDFSMKLWQAGVRKFYGLGKSLVYHFQSRSTAKVEKNNGRKEFAKKWKIPSSYFYKNILQMGVKYKEENQLKVKLNFAYFFARLRAFYISLF